jgi:hypothetical protein
MWGGLRKPPSERCDPRWRAVPARRTWRVHFRAEDGPDAHPAFRPIRAAVLPFDLLPLPCPGGKVPMVAFFSPRATKTYSRLLLPEPGVWIGEPAEPRHWLDTMPGLEARPLRAVANVQRPHKKSSPVCSSAWRIPICERALPASCYSMPKRWRARSPGGDNSG